MYARSQGPGLSKPKWHDAPTGSDYPENAAHVMRAIVYGVLGVRPGSVLDAELRVWATDASVKRTQRVRNVYRRVLKQMRRHGLLDPFDVRSARVDGNTAEIVTRDGRRLVLVWHDAAVEAANPSTGGAVEGPTMRFLADLTGVAKTGDD